jgi:hypothetical protein
MQVNRLIHRKVPLLTTTTKFIYKLIQVNKPTQRGEKKPTPSQKSTFGQHKVIYWKYQKDPHAQTAWRQK